MITLPNGGKLVQNVEELPTFRGARMLFLDVETARVFDDDTYGGMYPWKGDRICGFGVTVDDCPDIYYVPIRHSKAHWNLPVEPVIRWLQDLFNRVESWVNHNIKFDCTFVAAEGIDLRDVILYCTSALSKVHDSDRISYRLQDVCVDWLNVQEWKDLPKLYLSEIKSKNFADIPADLLGEYCIDDVGNNRRLFKYLQDKCSEGSKKVWQMEVPLTRVLLDMELEGLRIDRGECRKEQLKALTLMINHAEEIAEIADREFTNSFDCVNDILINQFGLPVLMTKKEREHGEEIDTGRATFDKNALQLYAVHPLVLADPKLVRLVQLIREYRKESQYNGLFLDPFLKLSDEYQLIHPSYNQIIRTGRMSCSRPNAQQQNYRSKRLIHPRAGMCFVSCDYSQIEFRLIVHYIEDQAAIQAYNENPKTDFHQWVAEMCGAKRKPAKTINFMMGYGGGKKKVTAKLATEPDIIEAIAHQVNEENLPENKKNARFKELCEQRALELYTTYHERLPSLKTTTQLAAQVCRMRGYVRTWSGRERHLPRTASWKAFNSCVQGGAMDIMKERMLALSPRFNPKSKELGIRLAANVHDEVLLEMPTEVARDPAVQDWITETLQTPSFKFRVPIITGLGLSPNSWAEAGGDETVKDGAGRVLSGKVR
jgi:DNA polymerase-1